MNSSATIHAEPASPVFNRIDEFDGGKLAPLISVDDLCRAMTIDRLQNERRQSCPQPYAQSGGLVFFLHVKIKSFIKNLFTG
jgi:hypothetical protein